MDQRLSLITLAVQNLPRSHAFYVEGLGWTPEIYVPHEVLMLRVGEYVLLSLWDARAFAQEVGAIAEGSGVPPITLAHNVSRTEQVDEILQLAERLGADPVMIGEHREWGGYSGYFADPDGYRWEIAVNPSTLGDTLLPPEARA